MQLNDKYFYELQAWAHSSNAVQRFNLHLISFNALHYAKIFNTYSNIK